MKSRAVSSYLGAVTFGLLAMVSSSCGADLHQGARSDQLVIEGEIQPGDCLKLLEYLSKEEARSLYLASPGGNLTEAMEIGRIARSLKLETIVPGRLADNDLNIKIAARHNLSDYSHNYMCASACFFIFVAGISRTSVPPIDPILGIHRPYFSENELRQLSSDQAITAAHATKAKVESYLNEMGVPSSFSEILFLVPPNAVKWITPDEFDSILGGVIPELRDWVDAKGKADLNELETMEVDSRESSANRAFIAEMKKDMQDPIMRERLTLEGLADDAWIQSFGNPISTEKLHALCRKPD